MQTSKTCVFCGNPANTREHIPAKQFFKGVPENRLITVPSCSDCNKNFQKNEDFFRQFLAGFLMDRSDHAKKLMENEVSRSIKRKPALGIQMFSQMKKVNLYTKSGIYLGPKTMYRVSDLDYKMINSVVEKIIKGLFYHEFGETIPEDWIIRIVWINPKRDKELGLTEMAKELKWNVIKDDTFAYGHQFVPETFQSIWILDFFKTPIFYILLINRTTAKENLEIQSWIFFPSA